MTHYSVTNADSQQKAQEIIERFAHLGSAERSYVEIKQDEVHHGYYPALVSRPCFSNRILCFLGWKAENRRLEIVSNFLIQWLETNARAHQETFFQNQDALLTLRAFFNRANLGSRFTAFMEPILVENERRIAHAQAEALRTHKEALQQELQEIKSLADRTLDQARENGKERIQIASQKKQALEAEVAALITTAAEESSKTSSAIIFHPVWPVNGFDKINSIERWVITKTADLAFRLLHRPGTTFKQLEKHIIRVDLPEGDSEAFAFPRPIKLVCDPSTQDVDVILCAKEILAAGGERRVRSCLSLRHGKLLVRKKCEGFEETIATHLQNHSMRGIIPIWAVLPNRKHSIVLEERYDSDLSYALSVGNIRDYHARSMMEDLLIGLAHLHTLSISNASMTIGNRHVSLQRFAISHKDIKPQNILVRKKPLYGGVEAVLCDFGGTNQISLAYGTDYFRSPEVVRQHLASTGGNLVDFEFYNKYGQKGDVWLLGMIFVTLILGGRVSQVKGLQQLGFPPIDSIEKHYLKGEVAGIPDGGLAHLTQEELDQDLERLRSQSSYPSLWTVTKKMLRIDPDERITAQESLNILKGYF